MVLTFALQMHLQGRKWLRGEIQEKRSLGSVPQKRLECKICAGDCQEYTSFARNVMYRTTAGFYHTTHPDCCTIRGMNFMNTANHVTIAGLAWREGTGDCQRQEQDPGAEAGESSGEGQGLFPCFIPACSNLDSFCTSDFMRESRTVTADWPKLNLSHSTYSMITIVGNVDTEALFHQAL